MSEKKNIKEEYSPIKERNQPEPEAPQRRGVSGGYQPEKNENSNSSPRPKPPKEE